MVAVDFGCHMLLMSVNLLMLLVSRHDSTRPESGTSTLQAAVRMIAQVTTGGVYCHNAGWRSSHPSWQKVPDAYNHFSHFCKKYCWSHPLLSACIFLPDGMMKFGGKGHNTDDNTSSSCEEYSWWAFARVCCVKWGELIDSPGWGWKGSCEMTASRSWSGVSLNSGKGIVLDISAGSLSRPMVAWLDISAASIVI